MFIFHDSNIANRALVSEKALGTYLDLELGIEPSTYGSTTALVETVLNLVLLTPYVGRLNRITFLYVVGHSILSDGHSTIPSTEVVCL